MMPKLSGVVRPWSAALLFNCLVSAITKPADDWIKPDFDATAWNEGPAGFGTDGMPGATITLTAHCHQTEGGQNIDIGLIDVLPR